MAVDHQPSHDRIIHDPDIMVGKPVIKGTRIPVELVLGHLARHFDLDDLFGAYPHLTLEDVQACMAYARSAVAAQPRPAPGRVTAAASA